MAIVSCSACQKKLKVADTSLGKKVKCSCGHVFVAQADGLAAAPIPVMAAEAPEKVIVACTECGSKVKVATASLGKKLKCPICAAVFVAKIELAAPKPVVAPVIAEPVHDKGNSLSFAQSATNDEDVPKPKKGQAPPPMNDDDEDDAPSAPRSRTNPEPKRPVPAKAAPKKYPSRILVNCFVFFMLFLFIGFFAGVLMFMEEESLIEPNTSNRQFLESFGWPVKAPRMKAPMPNQFPLDGVKDRVGDGPGKFPGKGKGPKGKIKDDDKGKVITGDKDKAIDGEKGTGKDANPKNKDDSTKPEKVGAAAVPSWHRITFTTFLSADEKKAAPRTA